MFASSCSASSLVAPFCSANCKADPFSPRSGVEISVATINFVDIFAAGGTIFASFAMPAPLGSMSLPSLSRNLKPSGINRPMPPSLVALPPTPTIMVLYPRSTSFASICPVPIFVSFDGLRSGSETRFIPDASVSPTSAVSSSNKAHFAVRVCPVGSMVFRRITFAPFLAFAIVSTNASPPSVIENSTTCASLLAARIPIFIACEAWLAESEPLNLSGTTRNFDALAIITSFTQTTVFCIHKTQTLGGRIYFTPTAIYLHCFYHFKNFTKRQFLFLPNFSCRNLLVLLEFYLFALQQCKEQ